MMTIDDIKEMWDYFRDDAIREATYYKWLDANYPPGDGVDFWLQAEQEWHKQLTIPDKIILNNNDIPDTIEFRPSPVINGCLIII